LTAKVISNATAGPGAGKPSQAGVIEQQDDLVDAVSASSGSTGTAELDEEEAPEDHLAAFTRSPNICSVGDKLAKKRKGRDRDRDLRRGSFASADEMHGLLNEFRQGADGGHGDGDVTGAGEGAGAAQAGEASPRQYADTKKKHETEVEYTDESDCFGKTQVLGEHADQTKTDRKKADRKAREARRGSFASADEMKDLLAARSNGTLFADDDDTDAAATATGSISDGGAITNDCGAGKSAPTETDTRHQVGNLRCPPAPMISRRKNKMKVKSNGKSGERSNDDHDVDMDVADTASSGLPSEAAAVASSPPSPAAALSKQAELKGWVREYKIVAAQVQSTK
jgi:hypothetical protein